MNQLNSDRLRNNLRAVVDNVEQVLHHLSDEAGDEIDELGTRARRRLHEAHDRIGDFEQRGATRLRRAGQRTQTYAHDHPWQLLVGLTIAAAALSVLARTRL